MAYNYGAPPGAFPPSYGPPGGAPPSMGAPPGMAPGMAPPPGMVAPPGMPPLQSPVGANQFQAPPGMPNINFNAPVIRLGVDQPKPNTPTDRMGGGGGRDFRGSNAEPLGRRDRLGLGADRNDRNLERDRAAVRESMMALQPPTREEVARTIFIGGIGEGAPNDAAIENLLRCAGKLRRWTRARDADDKVCKFGFAEYEDVDSLEAANEIFGDLEVPVFAGNSVVKDPETEEIKKMKLLMVVDEQSKNYIEEWKGKRREDDDARQFRIDGCKEDLRQCLAALANAGAFQANGQLENGDVEMGEGVNGDKTDGTEVVNIQVSLEDELSDIPADMRATVAAEIRAFRDRSNKRDIERMKREEELEQAERQRSGLRVNRLASPPPSSAPSGPASASNGIPVGPRERTVQGAPAGPKGYRGAQLPSDYVNGVAFVPANGTTNGISFNREDEDDPASDDELERRRQEKRDQEMQQEFERVENRWHRREVTRGAAQERERAREAGEERKKQRQKEEALKMLREWDDDEEYRKSTHEYYNDHSAWVRRRAGNRIAEERADERDRDEEERERREERRRTAEARGMAEDFMDRMDIEQRAQGNVPAAASAGFKISLGSAAARSKAATAAAATTSDPGHRAAGDVEGLLEDEEDAAASGMKRNKPHLQPLPATSQAPAIDMTDEERAAAQKELASEIPTDTKELFAFPLKYNYLPRDIIKAKIRPFVEKKIVDYLGVQEDLLVDAVTEGLEEKKAAEEILEMLGEAMDPEEAEGLMKKVWRLAVFWGECGARGIAG